MINSTTPVNHVNCRGFLYDAVMNVRHICNVTTITMPSAPMRCRSRMNLPKGTFVMMSSMFAYATVGDGV